MATEAAPKIDPATRLQLDAIAVAHNSRAPSSRLVDTKSHPDTLLAWTSQHTLTISQSIAVRCTLAPQGRGQGEAQKTRQLLID